MTLSIFIQVPTYTVSQLVCVPYMLSTCQCCLYEEFTLSQSNNYQSTPIEKLPLMQKYFIIDHKINITLILPCRTTIPYTYRVYQLYDNNIIIQCHSNTDLIVSLQLVGIESRVHHQQYKSTSSIWGTCVCQTSRPV